MLTDHSPQPNTQYPTPNTFYDVVVIGGGIIGTGIARDAALRGLSVALFEKEDFGAGTTSRSTRLIHGGLRYLQQGDVALVREDMRERERLLRNAPHLVKPLPFLIPFYRRSALHRLKLRAGLALYDLLAYDSSLPGHRTLGRAETLALEPGLNPDGLQGAALFYDAQISSPERLCVENIVDAEANGAHAFNHSEVIGPLGVRSAECGVRNADGEGASAAVGSLIPHSALRTPHSALQGVRVRDCLTGSETEVRAAVTINASGPWLDEMVGLLVGQQRRRLRRTKGIHFAAPPSVRHALILFSDEDERLFFVIPWLGHTWVGTTDTDYDGRPEEARATADEVAYLVRGARGVLPNARWDTIHFTQAGVRALVREEGKSPSAISRKHVLLDHAPVSELEGLISVVGGKLTAYRSIAEEAVDLACRKLGRDLRGTTEALPLPGGRVKSRAVLGEACESRSAECGLSPEQARHLASLYGARFVDVLEVARAKPELAARLHSDYPDIRAQVHHAVLRERCRTAADFLLRRSFLSFAPDQGRAALDAVIAEMAALCGWDATRCERERAEIHQALSLCTVTG